MYSYAVSVTWALVGVAGQRHVPAALPSTYCTGGGFGPRTSLDGCGKSRPSGTLSPDRQARVESLHRLSYRGHTVFMVCYIIQSSTNCARASPRSSNNCQHTVTVGIGAEQHCRSGVPRNAGSP